MSELSTATAALTLAASEMKEAKELFEDIRADVDSSATELANFVSQLSQDVNEVISSVMDVTLYVSHNGDDLNSGLSSSSPLKTLDKAFNLIPEGALGAIKLMLITDDNGGPLLYPVDTGLEATSKNIILFSNDGAGNGLKVFDGGGFIVRSGGSIKFANPYDFNIYIESSRTNDSLVYGYGGSVQFGGYYPVNIFNDSPSLKSIVKAAYHTGDHKIGSTFSFVGMTKLNTSESIQNNFSLIDGNLSCFVILNTYSCVLDAETSLFSSDLKPLQIPGSGAYLLSI
ncbi:hypothetical protein [Marinomonas sp. PE14-40]|uniref:hypothetical protein n=1 Tax=Marinomonas sp. PE14-40 TaxID=3060621 RepID=UPI003F663801